MNQNTTTSTAARMHGMPIFPIGFLGGAPRNPPGNVPSRPVQTSNLERTLRGLPTATPHGGSGTPPSEDVGRTQDKTTAHSKTNVRNESKPSSPGRISNSSSESFENASLSALQKLTNSPLAASGSSSSSGSTSTETPTSISGKNQLVEYTSIQAFSIQELVNKVVDTKSFDEEEEEEHLPILRGVLDQMKKSEEERKRREEEVIEISPEEQSDSESRDDEIQEVQPDPKPDPIVVEVKDEEETKNENEKSDNGKEEEEEAKKSATPKYLAYSQDFHGPNVAMVARKQYSIDEYDEFSDTEEERETSKSDSETVFTPPTTPVRLGGAGRNCPTPPSSGVVPSQQSSAVSKTVGSPRGSNPSSPGRATSPKGSLLARATSPRGVVFTGSSPVPNQQQHQQRASPLPKCVQSENKTIAEPKTSASTAAEVHFNSNDSSKAVGGNEVKEDPPGAKKSVHVSPIPQQNNSSSIKPDATSGSISNNTSDTGHSKKPNSPSESTDLKETEMPPGLKDNDKEKSQKSDKVCEEKVLSLKKDTKVPQTSNNSAHHPQHHHLPRHEKSSSTNSTQSENTLGDNDRLCSTPTTSPSSSSSKTEQNSALRPAGLSKMADSAKPATSEPSSGTCTDSAKKTKCNDIKSQVDGPSDFLDPSFTSSDSSDHEGISGVELTARNKLLEKFKPRFTRSQKLLRNGSSSAKIQEAKLVTNNSSTENSKTVTGSDSDTKFSVTNSSKKARDKSASVKSNNKGQFMTDEEDENTADDDSEAYDNCDDCETDEEAEEGFEHKTFPLRCPWYSRLHNRASYSAPTSPAAATGCSSHPAPNLSAHDDLVLTRQGSKKRKRKLCHLTPENSCCDEASDDCHHGNASVMSSSSSSFLPRSKTRKTLKGCQVNLEDIGKNPDFSRYLKSNAAQGAERD